MGFTSKSGEVRSVVASLIVSCLGSSAFLRVSLVSFSICLLVLASWAKLVAVSRSKPIANNPIRSIMSCSLIRLLNRLLEIL